ncbi:ABC transporter ATP-binding protein [Acholeplasma granularum]|uniref:ABC transporter ATP-binding protein n=1 Tax=Acholeplasma granularum TaxID=264635 RepID=UPI0004727908|nr:ABC transporter ATP-binding protein [Acholeplasma granularum]
MVKLLNVSKKYSIGEQEILANDDINFEIKQGEFCVILGPSGAGKTTILNILGGMDKPSSGEVIIDDMNVSKFNLKELTNYRRHDVGFVFQFYNLMPQLTALDNVEIASEIGKNPLDAKLVLEQVGLKNRMNNFPSQLSGGEQQRVSIARAIAKNPKILLCDEPTGALDIETGKQILQLLYDTCKIHNKTVIIVTHNQAIASIADRVISVKNGKVSSVKINNKPKLIEEVTW